MSPILRNRIASLALLAMGIALAGDEWALRNVHAQLERDGTLAQGDFQGAELNRRGCFVTARIESASSAAQEVKIKSARTYCERIEASGPPTTIEVRYLREDPNVAEIPDASPVSAARAAFAALWIAAVGIWVFMTFPQRADQP